MSLGRCAEGRTVGVQGVLTVLIFGGKHRSGVEAVGVFEGARKKGAPKAAILRGPG